MSADKYPSIFSRQMEAIVYIFSRQMEAIVYIFPNVQNTRCENDLKDNKQNSLRLGRKYARIFVLAHYLFLVATVFFELRARKTVRYSEQIMSADKYLSIFSRQMEAIVYLYIPLNK